MTWTEARDEIFTMLREAWVLNSGAIVNGDPPPVQWPGQVISNPPSQEFSFIRVTLRHVGGYQSSLGPTNGRLWDRFGVLTVQCFAPLARDLGFTTAQALAQMILDAFEGETSPGGVWFRDCTLDEVGPSDSWYQVNARISFTYSHMK